MTKHPPLQTNWNADFFPIDLYFCPALHALLVKKLPNHRTVYSEWHFPLQSNTMVLLMSGTRCSFLLLGILLLTSSVVWAFDNMLPFLRAKVNFLLGQNVGMWALLMHVLPILTSWVLHCLLSLLKWTEKSAQLSCSIRSRVWDASLPFLLSSLISVCSLTHHIPENGAPFFDANSDGRKVCMFTMWGKDGMSASHLN